MDLLSDVLTHLRLRGGLYFRADFSGAWAVAVPADRRRVRFHLVLSGECFVSVAEGPEPVKLAAGDAALIPHGAAQELSHEPGREPVALESLLERGALDGDGRLHHAAPGRGLGASLLCGYCRFDEGLDPPLLSHLPALLVLSTQTMGDLLSETAMGIAEIASVAGYESVPSFSRRFKTRFGSSPGAFRRRAGAA